ncbi:SlyX family protein [Pseudomonas kuykendallii]|uniref:SlyX family protein n=1 Tax=Pseudomonas kuykendallii TaxID=1007099 RepID=UPI0028962FC2|nr:SlyX family protein [Pseudomonas kuykendallii]
MSLESRMADLESRQAFQDDALQTLSDVVAEQQRLIDRLQMQLTALAGRQEELSGQVSGEQDEAPPPHY